MRRLTFALLLSGIALASGACKRASSHTQSEKPSGATPELLSVVAMDDPQADAQLVKGFYAPEGGPWRWTAGRFAVDLRPPPGAAQEGARLELMLNIPEVVLQQLRAVTLSATVGTNQLKPEKYTEPGNHVYTRDVPASALAGDRVTVEFVTDKAIPAGKIEKRELAVIVTRVGLVPKL